ncbi:hypothetical protein Patl1_15733 [Pistacia atlantica]|uniref:Uncharacterized protein n=1 Tax=Pistacia atlantica TaxID=434234 RepID=A0ACC1B9Y0_9ROSI|nr:hypothetical protein Patl1_15733 [Pistacia atlantica]
MAWRHRLMAFWVALVKGNESFLQTPFFERKKCSHLLEDHQGDRQPQLLVLLQFLVVINSNPSASPVAFQPPITRSASSSDNKLAKKASPTRRLSGTVKVFHIENGFGKVNDVDIKGSEAFLQTLFFERFNNVARTQHLVALTMLMEFLIVLDSGFGIGRIIKNPLIRYFNKMMEVRGLVAVVKLASPCSFPIVQFHSFLSESDFVFAQFHSFLS